VSNHQLDNNDKTILMQIMNVLPAELFVTISAAPFWNYWYVSC